MGHHIVGCWSWVQSQSNGGGIRGGVLETLTYRSPHCPALALPTPAAGWVTYSTYLLMDTHRYIEYLCKYLDRYTRVPGSVLPASEHFSRLELAGRLIRGPCVVQYPEFKLVFMARLAATPRGQKKRVHKKKKRKEKSHPSKMSH
jgi:hypothetical protein